MIIASKDVDKSATPLRSTHSVVAIVDVGDSQKSLLLPIEITAERSVNGERMDVNALSSVYEKTVKNLVNEAIARENAGEVGVYYVKKEALTLPGAGVQFPIRLQQSTASNGIVHSFSEKVNMNILNVTQSKQFKRWFGDWQNDSKNASKIVNVDGTPKIIYHQTGTEFYEFSNANPRAGLNDSETPNGFFAKDNATDIGLEGNMQMAMYGDMKKPLHFKNRTEARVWYEQNIDGYEELQKQCDIVEQKFNERFEIQERFNDEYYEQNVEQCTIFGGLFNRGTYNILSLFCIICMTVHCNLGSGYRNYNQYDHLLKWV